MGLSSTATVTITIIGQNEAPVITSGLAGCSADGRCAYQRYRKLARAASPLPTLTSATRTRHRSQPRHRLRRFVLSLDAKSRRGDEGRGEIGWTFSVPDSAIQHLWLGQDADAEVHGERRRWPWRTDDRDRHRHHFGHERWSRDQGRRAQGRDRGQPRRPGHGRCIRSSRFPETSTLRTSISSASSRMTGAVRAILGRALDAVMIADTSGGGQGAVQWIYQLANNGPRRPQRRKAGPASDDVVIDEDAGRGKARRRPSRSPLVGVKQRREDSRFWGPKSPPSPDVCATVGVQDAGAGASTASALGNSSEMTFVAWPAPASGAREVLFPPTPRA